MPGRNSYFSYFSSTKCVFICFHLLPTVDRFLTIPPMKNTVSQVATRVGIEPAFKPFEGSITGAFTCANCSHRTIHFEAAVAAYRGRGIVRQIIHEFKYVRQIHLRHVVAHWLRAALDDERLREQRFDLIVPVPLHPTRQRERGFNQASLIAELLSAQISIPARPVLERIRYTTTQTALDRSERMENLHNAFRLRKNADVRGLGVLLVDDVLTTGSTLNECVRVLKLAGAFSVHAATAARA
jgi:ComF family protein